MRYNGDMVYFGKGKRLIDVSKYLRDPKKRWAMILDAAERNSMIAGLPPFTEKMKKELLREFESG